jgi:hypothetical protein
MGIASRSVTEVTLLLPMITIECFPRKTGKTRVTGSL